jgi:hypothetical protein
MMGTGPFNLNAIIGWLWITVGVLWGFLLGLSFHRDDWLGGYGGFRRRLYRLAHIAFFGLGIINVLFALTMSGRAEGSTSMAVASYGFALGAVAMPICCLVMAHRPRWRALFLIPVIAVFTASVLTLAEVWCK